MKVLQHQAQRKLAVSFFVASLFSISSQAIAGGTANDNQSAQGIATAGAGQAAEAGDASVIFFNPAAMTRFKRAEVHSTTSFAMFDNDYTSLRNQDGAPTNSGTQGSAGQQFSRKDGADASLIVPGLFVVIPVNEKLVVGFSGSGSHGLLARYDENFPGRGQGREIDFKISRFNLGFGYKLSPTLSVGANGSYERYFQSIKLRLNFRDAVNKLAPTDADVAPVIDAIQPIPEEVDAKLRMFGWALNAQAGVLWEPTEKTRIGVSYRPKTRFKGNSGKLTINDNEGQQEFRDFLATSPLVNNPVVTGGLGINGAQAAGDLAPFQRVRQNIDFPDEFRLSIFHHFSPKLDLMASYGRQDFSVSRIRFERESNGRPVEDVPQNFRVTQAYRVGLNYRAFKRLTLHAGYATENGAVKDDLRLPILPDNDRQFYGLGATLDLSRDTVVTFAYQFLDVKEGQVGNNKSITPVEVSGADYNGITNLDVKFFSIGLSERF